MKKILFLTMLCVGILAPTIAQNIPSYVPTNGLVGWWPFNGNANDESGSGLNGELINESSGLTFSSDRNGNENSTIEFNSSGFGQESAPYVNISNSSSIIFNQEYSFNIWTKIGNNSEVAELINRGPDNNSFLSRFQGLNGFAFGNFPNYFNNSMSIDIDNWHMYTFIRTISGNGLLYVDGQLIESQQISSMINNGNNFAFGKMPSGGTNGSYYPYQGKLDDIAIYNRALTQEEITALYTSTPPCTNPSATITPQGNTTFCQGGFVNLNASTGSNYSYQWFNNGQILNGATNSTYQATDSGNYSVIVSNENCSSTSNELTVKVNPLPIINSIVSKEVCYGNSLILKAEGVRKTDTLLIETFSMNMMKAFNHTTPILQKGVKYYLKVYGTVGFAGGVNSQDAAYQYNWFGSPLTPYAFPNSTNVWWNINGTTANRPTPDIYNPNHIYYFPLTGNGSQYNFTWSDNPYSDNSGQLNFELYRINENNESLTFSWDNNVVNGVQFTPNTTRNYTLTVSDTNNCITMNSVLVTVQPKPLAVILSKSTTNIKENESVVLAATKGNGYTYAWNKDGIAIANATDSNYTATLPGVYTVKVTSAACDSTSAGVTVKRAYALPNYLPTNGLVGWWPFNGNANDESGNENHGTVNGATLTTDRNGEVNKAYNFDGINDYIKVSNMKFTGNTKYTVSLWLNLNSGKREGYPQHYILDNGTTVGGVFINTDVDQTQFGCKDISSINEIGQWYHFLAVVDGQTYKLRINGIEVGNSSGCALEFKNDYPLIFGCSNVYTEFTDGKIDDIAIWNRILSEEEITALYLGEACTTPIATATPQSATNFCQGGSVNLNAAINANYTYQWLNNGTPISKATTATYKATTSGKYSIIVKNNSGCIDTSSVITVTVTPTPSLPILTGPARLCYNSKAIFKASIAGGTWGVANDYLLISSPQGLFRNNKMPPSNLYKTGVTYTLKSKDKLCSVTAQKSVWIRNVAATSVTLTATKQTLKVGEVVSATATTKITGNALFWMSASTSFVSVTGVSPYIALVKGLRPATGANITFSVDDAAKGCRNTAFLPFTVTAAASLVENESNTSSYTTDLNVYPNPSNGMVTIENIGEAKTISLIDVTGRVLKTTPVNADRMRLDFSNITKGNYFISIQGETIKEMKSIVIE